jgi:hypothetical protein
MNRNYNILTQETYNFIEKTQNRFIKSKKRVQKFTSYAFSYATEKEYKLTPKVLDTISDCGSWLEFRNYYKQDKTKLHNANFCKKDKLCPACAMRRASKQVKKVYDTISYSDKLKNKNWYYIVLPVKHNITEDFETVFNRAKDGLQKLRKSLDNAKQKRAKNFFSQFDGLFYSFEVTKSSNGWNVHINLLCCSDKEIQGIYKYTHKNGQVTYQHHDIMRDWSKYTDNNSYMHSINKLDTSSKDDIIKNLLEVFKYSLKFQDLENKDLLEVYEKTYQKRLLGAFGILYNIKLDVELENDEVLDEEFLEIVYRFNYKTNTYEEHSKEYKIEKPKTKKELQPIDRTKLVKKKHHRYTKITIYDKFGYQESTQIKVNMHSFSDYELFAKSIQLQKFKAPQV